MLLLFGADNKPKVIWKKHCLTYNNKNGNFN